MEYKHVDENARILTGDAAMEKLKIESDRKYLGSDGITQVDEERWNKAQQYEFTEWIHRASFADDDRNHFHKKTFNNYECLSNVKNVDSFIELGCGPFTNARIILEKFKNIEDITLLDPLAEGYMDNHRNCKYKNSVIEAGSETKNVKVISSSIENFEIDRTYDMVVMINVLEHCFDIPKILSKIKRMMSPGGYFIYADVQFDLETIEKISSSKYNAGHPIRFTKEYMNSFLEDNFEQVFSNVIDETVANEPAEERYFIGKFKG
jgi:SAM-dependent methyltransferase